MRRSFADWPYTIPEDTGSKIPRTYELSHTTLIRLVTLAKAKGCFPSNLVEALLVHGLDQIESGALVVDKKPIFYAIELKPKSGKP